MTFPFRWVLPQMCCACLGPAEVVHEVSAFHGEDGKSIVTSFDVPMCRACRKRMKQREGLGYFASFAAFGVGALFAAPEPLPPEITAVLKIPGAVLAALGFIGFLLVGMGRPFEPARYVEHRPRFLNAEYQRRFEEANADGAT